MIVKVRYLSDAHMIYQLTCVLKPEVAILADIRSALVLPAVIALISPVMAQPSTSSTVANPDILRAEILVQQAVISQTTR